MNSSRVGEFSLSSRLEKMKSFYSGQSFVWDIGCDHGLLGLSFLETNSVHEINLVDSSHEVMKVLKKKIDSYITNTPINILCMKGQEIKMTPEGQCIFIAGMGGEEIGQIISRLLPQIGFNSQFVISPQRKILHLRALLRTIKVHLKSEELLFENDQYYQILVVAPGEGRKVSLFGEDFWITSLGRNYLEHQKKYFSLHRDKASLDYASFLASL
jgi:tRNA (adenine22-N1)-methyltransferase